MADLSDERKQQIKDYLSHPLLFPADFKNYVSDYVTTNIPKISVQQILGFELWQIKSAPEILTEQSRASTAYGDMATVGPVITGLSPGFYIVIWGCNTPYTGNSNDGYMGISINGDTPTTSREAFSTAGAFGSAALLDLSLTVPPITLTAKYKTALGTSRNMRHRWMHAMRW